MKKSKKDSKNKYFKQKFQEIGRLFDINNKKITSIVIFSILFLVLFDLITKWIFINKTYFKEFFIFIQYSKNYGSSFGIFSDFYYYSLIIVILSVFAVVLLIKNYNNYFLKNKYLIFTFIFIVSGILGNTYDRIFYGYVRDFIALKHLFIFNLADLYLTVGVIIYIMFELSENKSLKNKKKKV